MYTTLHDIGFYTSALHLIAQMDGTYLHSIQYNIRIKKEKVDFLCKRVHKGKFIPQPTRKHAIKLLYNNVVCHVKNIKLIFSGAETENITR